MSVRAERRARRPIDGGLVAAAVAALGLVGACLVPAQSGTAPVTATADAEVTVLCPSAPAARATVASGGRAEWSPLVDPQMRERVDAGAPFALQQDPVRLAMDRDHPVLGLVSAADASGTSLARCQAPGSRWWFTGVRSGREARTELVLVNGDEADAVVNVAVTGPDGPVATPGSRGIRVPGRSQRAVALGPLVTVAEPVSLEVTTSAGRVTAVVREALFQGTSAAGTGWVQSTQAPSTTLAVPAVPAGPGARTLVVSNPSDRTAQLDVEVLSTDGAFAPVGAEKVDVPAASTRSFALEGALGGRAVGLRLRSSRPVSAAVESRSPLGLAVVGTAAPFGSSGAFAVAVPSGAELSTLLSNPGRAVARVTVVATSGGRETVRRIANLAPGSSLALAVPATGASQVSIESSDAELRVAAVLTGPGSGLAASPIESVTAEKPTVRLDRVPGPGR